MANDNDLTDDYVLSKQLLSDGEPARCVTIHSGSSLELLSGSQGGIISKFSLPDYHCNESKKQSANRSENGDHEGGGALEIQPGGANTRHPHQITAILSSSCLSIPALSSIYVTGCKDGKIRVMDGITHNLKETLEGHSNAVTSLSWVSPHNNQNARPWLVSGSWDGTAKIWDIFDSSACIGTLSGHENTVSVAGLPAESDSIRKVVTVSAGIAEGNSIRGHTVRIWTLSDNKEAGITSKVAAQVANDHSGPMRDVCYDPETHSIYTCSNDGTVKIRSAEDGKCIETLVYPGYDQPMLLSVCVVGDSATKAVVVGAEDGNVAIFNVGQQKQQQGEQVQVICHPGCVWNVESLWNTGNFVSACHDGNIRIFTRCPSLAAPPDVLKAFQDAVTEAKAVRSTGPSAEEIAKLPKWEMNALTQGRSEGQVQVFQKDGKAIAAQWSAMSGTWIEVGEVTGTNTNAGTLNGRQYDHVLPIEVDVPGGGVQKLHIGYNNGENPFVTAQQFIDEHMLDQNYLAQIADYIRQRAGESGPTLGMMGGGYDAAMNSSGGGGRGGSSFASETAVPMDTSPSYGHLPMNGYKTFETGVDKKGLTKVVQKIREFNSNVLSNQLSPVEAGEALDKLTSTLSITNRYHSSVISLAELAPLHTMILRWDAQHAFPGLDLARMTVLHPDAAKSERLAYWEEILDGSLDMCLGLGDAVAKEVAVPMLTMRLIANCYKGGPGSAGAAGNLINKILDCAEACATSDNKNVRLSVATAILNTSSYMYASSTERFPPAVAARVVDVVGAIVGCGKYESEAMVRSLVALGTVLLLPGGCGSEVKMLAKERSVGSMVERVASDHGEMVCAVSNEIMSILTS